MYCFLSLKSRFKKILWQTLFIIAIGWKQPDTCQLKENVADTKNEILFNPKKKEKPATHYCKDKP